jgi:predicted transposase/invertase (TIGR01784 family)
MVPGVDPRVDYAFKKVFGSQVNIAILLDLLEAVLRPSRAARIVDAQILNRFNEKDTTDDKLSILDIKACDQKGRHYNIEMQMVGTDVFPHRALYYWAVVHGHQLQEGDDYIAFQPTISIGFATHSTPAQRIRAERHAIGHARALPFAAIG